MVICFILHQDSTNILFVLNALGLIQYCANWTFDLKGAWTLSTGGGVLKVEVKVFYSVFWPYFYKIMFKIDRERRNVLEK